MFGVALQQSTETPNLETLYHLISTLFSEHFLIAISTGDQETPLHFICVLFPNSQFLRRNPPLFVFWDGTEEMSLCHRIGWLKSENVPEKGRKGQNNKFFCRKYVYLNYALDWTIEVQQRAIDEIYAPFLQVEVLKLEQRRLMRQRS